MTTSPAQRNGSARTAGIVALVGGLIGAVFAVYVLATLPYEVTLAANVLAAVAHLTMIIGLAGLAVLGAAGSAWWGRIGIGVAVLGFVVLIGAELTEPFDEATATAMFEIAPLVIGLGMLLAGVAVLRAHRWSGWRRFVPVAIGAYVFVAFLPVAIAGGEAGFWLALVGWFMGYAALGLAVVREASGASVDVGPRDRTRVA